MSTVIDELTCSRSQMFLPLASFDMLAGELLERVAGMCCLHLDMTLNQYHATWWDLVDVENEVCAAAKREESRLRAESRRAEKPKDRRYLKAQAEEVRAFIHDAHGAIENLFLFVNQPVLEAAQIAWGEDADDWFSNCISNERACEHCGSMTLRQIIENE